MDFERFRSVMRALGPPENIENHQKTIGFANVFEISSFSKEPRKNWKSVWNAHIIEHGKRYKTCVKLHNLKKCRFMRSTGDWSKIPRNKLQNMHFRLGKNAY